MLVRMSRSGGDVRVGALERGGPRPSGCAALAGREGHEGCECLVRAFLGS
jgi:hypothetical protein